MLFWVNLLFCSHHSPSTVGDTNSSITSTSANRLNMGNERCGHDGIIEANGGYRGFHHARTMSQPKCPREVCGKVWRRSRAKARLKAVFAGRGKGVLKGPHNGYLKATTRPVSQGSAAVESPFLYTYHRGLTKMWQWLLNCFRGQSQPRLIGCACSLLMHYQLTHLIWLSCSLFMYRDPEELSAYFRDNIMQDVHWGPFLMALAE